MDRGGEYLLSIAQPHGAWLSLGYTQADVLPVLHVAAVTGVWGVTFLVTGVAATIAAIAAPGDRRGRIRVAASALAILAVAGAYASVRLLATPRDPTVRVAVLGGPLDAELRPDTAEGRAQLDRYLEQIAEQADHGARVVVLPEKVFDTDDRAWPLLAGPLARIATARQVDVVVGATARRDGVAGNIAVAFPANGTAPVTYTKKHLIPGLEEELTAGDGPPVRVPGEPALGLIICKDLDVPGLTPYARIGDVFAWLCIAAVGALIATTLRRSRPVVIAQRRADGALAGLPAPATCPPTGSCRRGMLTKLSLRDRVQATAFAYESGLIRPGSAFQG